MQLCFIFFGEQTFELVIDGNTYLITFSDAAIQPHELTALWAFTYLMGAF